MKTLQEFRAFFDGIPKDRWIARHYSSHDNARHCVLGHLNPQANVGHHNDDSLLFKNLVWGVAQTSPIFVNDGDHPDFQQPTPKARILALCDTLIAKEQP